MEVAACAFFSCISLCLIDQSAAWKAPGIRQIESLF
jgi:hypothetical protein